LQQFIPDSILTTQIKFLDKSTIHPIGKIEKEAETYLLFKHKYNKQQSVFTIVYNNKNEFLAYKPLLNNNNNDGYIHSVVINREPTFSINKDKMDRSTQTLKYTRVGWAFTASAGTFINVVNETNEDEKRNNTIINPIDTLPKNTSTVATMYKTKKFYCSKRWQQT
jgi:hypothetical protein